VSWQSTFPDPSINRIPGYPKVGSHIFDAHPAFFSVHLIPLDPLSMIYLLLPIKLDKSILKFTFPVKSKRWLEFTIAA
jgi:hypothetical protein